MEVIAGVHTIEGLGIGRAYLYLEADSLTLIDTGLAGSADRILAAIEALGRRPQDLRQVVVTHHHRDHAGSLADVVERTDAQVLVHAIDAPVVRGDAPPPVPAGIGALLARRAQPAKPARVDRELQDGDEIDLDGRATVVHVPGHTAGSIALYLPARRLLFAGDAATGVLGVGAPAGPFGMFNENASQVKDSFRKLAALDFDVACFGHGKPLDRDASREFRIYAERRLPALERSEG